jgi:hypothetical protein
VSGFLPAPTLSSPAGVVPGAGSVITEAQPPLAVPAVPAFDRSPTATPPLPTAVPVAVQLIDTAAVALGYAWLCCGVAFLIAAAATLVWLARRSGRRR